MTHRPAAGAPFPITDVAQLGGGTLRLGAGAGWQMVIIYRGKHCGKCLDYLTELEPMRAEFARIGVSVTVASADSEAKARAFIDQIGYTGPVGYGLTVPQMQALGLYISDPLSPDEADGPFAEPGMFIINPEGVLQVHDTSTAPWARPSLPMVLGGIAFVQDKGRPPRGTHTPA